MRGICVAVRRRLCILAACAAGLSGCGESPTAPTPTPEPPLQTLVEFTVEVVTPCPYRSRRCPIADAVVTIAGGGETDGWTGVTDSSGLVTFTDYPLCAQRSEACRSRRFRAEKARYEPREVGADEPYWGADSDPDTRSWHPTFTRIILGLEWPSDPQLDRLRREVPAIEPHWLVESREEPSGRYSKGVIIVHSLTFLSTIAHEYCHAHQDWVIDPDYYRLTNREYGSTPEGQAYIAAREADRAAGYEADWYPSALDNQVENAASVCSLYYFPRNPQGGPDHKGTDLRVEAPHQYAWAAEWLPRR